RGEASLSRLVQGHVPGGGPRRDHRRWRISKPQQSCSACSSELMALQDVKARQKNQTAGGGHPTVASRPCLAALSPEMPRSGSESAKLPRAWSANGPLTITNQCCKA